MLNCKNATFNYYLHILKHKNMKKRLTKKLFCSIYDAARKMRRTDPIQFEVMYNDWKRLRQKHL